MNKILGALGAGPQTYWWCTRCEEECPVRDLDDRKRNVCVACRFAECDEAGGHNEISGEFWDDSWIRTPNNAMNRKCLRCELIWME